MRLDTPAVIRDFVLYKTFATVETTTEVECHKNSRAFGKLTVYEDIKSNGEVHYWNKN